MTHNSFCIPSKSSVLANTTEDAVSSCSAISKCVCVCAHMLIWIVILVPLPVYLCLPYMENTEM